MKKCIWTLNVENYAPEICALTYPLLRYHAQKIGADFRIIKSRKFPTWPVVYEKMQIHELGKDYDWNIYIDSDAIVHPDMFDVTNHIPKTTVMHNGADMAGCRWTYDEYFWRDGRHIGSCNWFTVGSDWCLDLWRPLEIPLEEALSNIRPILFERAKTMEQPKLKDGQPVMVNNQPVMEMVPKQVITREHLIDDYTLSRNIARFGLKFTTVMQTMKDVNDTGNYLWHQYTMTPDVKVMEMKQVLRNWKVDLKEL